MTLLDFLVIKQKYENKAKRKEEGNIKRRMKKLSR